ncbi:CheR family methyltransferase [Teichococcus aestuarii]|uniref:Chemotaxis protein CheR n=1 Tax=Teichococcus aestuarii TaxID=568898 RepID=A0A2U1V4B5_9PROT|nr:CheR family methyltransferase [Pseudoroseomonas aestuarii]PWC28736.1 chemotaxis protein CheR [Pseudoroseomonas aestuarii]
MSQAFSSGAAQRIAHRVREVSGLVLGPGQGYLLSSRLAPLLARHRLAGLEALAASLGSPGGTLLAQEAAEALATNETSFFRDGAPFRHLAEAALPRLAAARPPGAALRIWSAACSTGQEAYSVAMLARELQPALGGRPVSILGTDICGAVLERARAGLYTEFEMQRGLSPERRARWFTPEGQGWRAAATLRADCRFERANLVGPLGVSGTFDIILLRNLLIYLDQPTKERVLEACQQRLAPDGVLYLGAAETLLGLNARLAPLEDYRSAYRPAAGEAA